MSYFQMQKGLGRGGVTDPSSDRVFVEVVTHIYTHIYILGRIGSEAVLISPTRIEKEVN